MPPSNLGKRKGQVKTRDRAGYQAACNFRVIAARRANCGAN